MRKFVVDREGYLGTLPPPTDTELKALRRIMDKGLRCKVCGKPLDRAIVIKHGIKYGAIRYGVYCFNHATVPRLYVDILEKVKAGRCDFCGREVREGLNLMVMVDKKVFAICDRCNDLRFYPHRN